MEYKKEPYDSWTNLEKTMTYLFYKTKDNSISVSLKNENVSTELMHSVDGAFSETIYLYEDVVKYVLNNTHSSHNIFLSLGLGMGYIEILVCAYTLKYFPNVNFKIYSYEKEPELREFFQKYILDKEIPSVFQESYDSILKLFCEYYELNCVDLKKELRKGNIIFCHEYNNNVNVELPVNGLFFDAFSINTSPELWEDALIQKILKQCHKKCAAFATYAARTHLKKLLVEFGFQLQKKPGYGGKKESTFAFK